MPVLARRYTVAGLLAFPEDGMRYELIHGDLQVSPGPRPRYQEVVFRLGVLLRAHLSTAGAALRVVLGPAEISWDETTLVQPDMLVGPVEQTTDDWRTFRSLVLAVEVSSPSSRRTDRVEMRRLHQENGVESYWVVDHESRLVEIWRPGEPRPEIITETLNWRLSPGSPQLAIPLERLFAGLPE